MILVGIDGSESSRDALAWALAEARVRDVPVRVLAAWHYAPVAYAWPAIVPPVDPGLAGSLRQHAIDAVTTTVDALREEARGVEVSHDVVEGSPGNVLVEAAGEAELLVVGSRGHGAVTGLLLGSVSQHCAQHAPCPVVIVRKAA